MNENYQPRGATATNNFSQINSGPRGGTGPSNNRNTNNKNRYKNKNNNSNNRQNNFSTNETATNAKVTPHFQNNQNANHLNTFNDFSTSSCSNPPYNLEFGNQKSKKYPPFNKFSQSGNNAQANMMGTDNFDANGVNIGAKKKRTNNRRKNKNSNAAPNGTNNSFQRTNSFGNNITNNHYHVKPFSTDRLNKSLNKDYSSSSNSSFEDINPRIKSSISLDNFESFSVNFKRSPTMPLSLSTFSHDQYSNVNTSPSQKLKFHREEPTIQESAEDDENISLKANERQQQQQQQHQQQQQYTPLVTLTSNQDDSVSFYSTPLNGTKNGSTSSSSSGLNEEQLAKFLNTAETCSSGSISPCSKVFNELSANNGESQLLVTASEGEYSFELDAATENTIINGAVEMSYEKELELLDNCTNQVPFSIKKMVFVMEDKEINKDETATPVLLNNENQLLIENISPRTSLSNDSENDNETPIPSSVDLREDEALSNVLPSLADVKSETIIDDYGLTPSYGNYVDLITPESLSIPHEHELNLADVQHQLEKDNLYLINEEATLKYSNIEEEEVNELVNKIVVDVIAHAAQTNQLLENVLPQVQQEKDLTGLTNAESLDKAKDESILIDFDKEVEPAKNDESVLVEINSKEIDSMLKKSEVKEIETVETKNADKKEAKSSAKKDANKKDAVVDCFSCTIV